MNSDALPTLDGEPPSQENPLQFTSHGKLLLFGEHAAVYGHPALGAALPSSIQLNITESPAAGKSFPGLGPQDSTLAEALLGRLVSFIPGLVLHEGNYSFTGNIPRSAGFGSSAAVCVALARYAMAASAQQGLDLNFLLPKFEPTHQFSDEEKYNYLLWQISNNLEQIFHGSPSGIDTGLAMGRGLIAFFPRSRTLPDTLPIQSPGIHLVLGALPRESNTKTLVEGIQEGMLGDDNRITNTIEDLGDYAHSAIDLLNSTAEKEGRPESRLEHSLADLADKAHEKLCSLDLSTAHMDKILRAGVKMGALGGKLSGAGAGGAFYLVCPHEEAAAAVQKELSTYCTSKNITLASNIDRTRI